MWTVTYRTGESRHARTLTDESPTKPEAVSGPENGLPKGRWLRWTAADTGRYRAVRYSQVVSVSGYHEERVGR